MNERKNAKKRIVTHFLKIADCQYTRDWPWESTFPSVPLRNGSERTDEMNVGDILNIERSELAELSELATPTKSAMTYRSADSSDFIPIEVYILLVN